MTNNSKRRILNAISGILATIMLFSIYKIFTIYDGYRKEAVIHTEVNEFNPNTNSSDGETDETESSTDNAITKLKTTYPDAIGWLTIDDSKIDYPFVQTTDNDKYVTHAIDGSKLKSGAIFMDCRNSSDMSDFTSIIYGHHMKNGSMFGTLKNFKEKAFFKNSTGGKLFLENEVLELTPLAYMVISHDDETVYRAKHNTDEEKQELLDYVKAEAIHYNDCSPTVADKFIVLSTCNYSFENARSVVIFKVK